MSILTLETKQGLSASLNFCGVDVRKFELKLSQIDPFVRKLRKIYKVNPEWFEIPEFALRLH